MTVEIPHFLATTEVDQVVLSVEQHRERPAVLFEMLGATSLRSYNTSTPKEENMYLASLAGRPEARGVITELDLSKTQLRISNVIHDFEDVCNTLRNISDRQIEALVEYAQRRLTSDHLDQ